MTESRMMNSCELFHDRNSIGKLGNDTKRSDHNLLDLWSFFFERRKKSELNYKISNILKISITTAFQKRVNYSFIYFIHCFIFIFLH